MRFRSPLPSKSPGIDSNLSLFDVSLVGEYKNMQQACADWLAVVWSDLKLVQWLEWAKAIFDLIKGVAWPLALFLIIWIFRQEIRPRFKDLISAGTGGLVFHPPTQPVQPGAQTGAVSPTPVHPMKSVNQLMESIKSDLQNYQEPSRETALIASLAQARIEASFESMFGVIFASQIDALKELSRKSASIAEAQVFFEMRVKPKNDELYSVWDFDQWSAFLIGQRLVAIDGENVIITDLGRDFLLFIETKKADFQKSN